MNTAKALIGAGILSIYISGVFGNMITHKLHSVEAYLNAYLMREHTDLRNGWIEAMLDEREAVWSPANLIPFSAISREHFKERYAAEFLATEYYLNASHSPEGQDAGQL